MKRIFLLFFAMICMIQITNAQTTSHAEELTVSENAGVLKMDWVSEKSLVNNEYWEVQASDDAQNFRTVGLVLGVNPKQKNGYHFKQNKLKMSGKYTHFRVLRVDGTAVAIASKTVKL